MKRIIILLCSLLLILSFTACSGNKENNKKVTTNDTTEQVAKKNPKDKFQKSEIDPYLKKIAEKILADNELFGELNDETKASMIMPANTKIFEFLNQSFGSSLDNGIIINNEDLAINITIYESFDAPTDAEILRNPPDMEEMVAKKQKSEGDLEDKKGDFQDKKGDFQDKKGDLENKKEDFENQKKDFGDKMNIFPDTEDSEVKVIGNFIIIAKTANNSKVFEICEIELNNVQ